MLNQPTRIAVIGAGAMGRNHLRVLHDLESADLIALADADEATAQKSARRFNIPAYVDHRHLLDAVKPDAVVVAVPTALHREVVLDAVARGVHILVEKPIASTVDEGQELMQAARAAGVILAVGHIERYNPAIV